MHIGQWIDECTHLSTHHVAVLSQILPDLPICRVLLLHLMYITSCTLMVTLSIY